MTVSIQIDTNFTAAVAKSNDERSLTLLHVQITYQRTEAKIIKKKKKKEKKKKKKKKKKKRKKKKKKEEKKEKKKNQNNVTQSYMLIEDKHGRYQQTKTRPKMPSSGRIK